MKRKMEKSIVYGARCIFSLLLAFFMVLGFMPKVVLAEKADKMAKDPIVDHPLNEKNNWDIRYELIMPGERFYTVPEYSASKEKLTYGSEVVGLWIQYSHASLMLSHPENQAGGEVVLDTDKLVRSTPNISQLIPQETTYNAIETAYNRGDLAFITGNPSIYDTCKEALKSAIKDKKQAIIGYRNDTNLPMVLEAVRGGTDTTEGMVKGGRYGEDVLVQERVMHNWGCQLCFYEPYYTLSYDIKGIDEKLTEEEKKELPDRYYIQRTRQELVLKNPIRAGRHFVEWSSMGFHEDVRVADGKTTLAFDWEHNLGHHKTYIGDQILHAYFKDGFTVTFNPNGGRLKEEDPAVREIDTTDYEDNLFFDIGECIPVREGYKFEGWCTSPSADANSFIQNTENSKWIEDWFEERMYDTDINKYDIQLYAKWKKVDPCAKGHKLQEIVTQATTNSNGKIITKCSVCDKVFSTKRIAKIEQMDLASDIYTYDGTVKTPQIIVKDSDGELLEQNKDYVVTYAEGRKKVGNYSITIKLKENYSGEVKKTFTIKPKSTNIFKVLSGKKKLTVKWKKQTKQTNGYQIQYSTSPKFKGAKNIIISKNKRKSKTISKLKAKKKYYIRIRTYKKLKENGKSYNIYSSWSKIKTKKVK